jgi:hypothetical protein
MKRIPLGLAALLGSSALLGSPAAFADEADCKVALDAVTRVLATPNHQFMTRTDSAGVKRQSEVIDTGIAMYVQVGGKWRTSPMTPQGMQAMMIESQKRATATSCRKLREEPVGGTSATVYSVHNETEAGITDSILWISDADGLPLKQDVTLDGGTAGKSRSEVRFDYKDVKAPPGVG